MDTADAIRSRIGELASVARLPQPRVRKALRIAAGLTQADVAGSIGVTRVTVSRWETGVREPRGALRRSYAEALEVMRDV